MAALLALVGACGKAGGGGDGGGAKSGAGVSVGAASQGVSGEPAAEGGKGLGQKALDRLALSGQDVPGYGVTTVSGKGSPVDRGSVMAYRAATPAPCRPVYAAAQLGSLHDFSAQVVQDVVSDSDGLGQHASVSLASYTRADAGLVMSELRAALAQCTAADMRPSAAHPDAGLGLSGALPRSVSGYGDEALAFDATQVVVDGGAGLEIPVTVLVVRQDSTVATFMSLNPIQPPAIPQDVLDAQLKKLA
ncbi:hypothetical protein [Streptomyces justiciae]|uniref:hypothetical protein n=1 Tax=Streptomyces justiciae TaxID=2780140 RepID=UPI002118CAD2|nr:hypothetical protein [Streptomyces justiciae]MCW8382435.1 hypothetical protein [Streptomyces justiciae]